MREKSVLSVRAVFALCCLLFLLLLSGGPVPSAAESMPSLSFRYIGTVTQDQANLYATPSKKGQVLLKLSRDEQYEILGGSDDFFRIRVQDQVGYVNKRVMNAAPVRAEEPLPEKLCGTVSLADPIPDRHEDYLIIQGKVTCGEPLDALFLYVWDDRLYRLERFQMKSLPQPSETVDLSFFLRSMPTNKLTGGRKIIVLEGSSGGQLFVLFRSPAYISRENENPSHVTSMCTGIPGTLLDDKLSTAWVPKKKSPELRIGIPAEANAALLTLEWKKPPASYTLTLLDENDAVLEQTEKADGFWLDAVPLSSAVRGAVIRFEDDGKAALSSLRVYAEPYPRHVIQQWEPIPENVDILLVSTHQDDELLFFGGTIPEYASREGVTIAVVYMADCGRIRYREALDGLWTCGLKYHPVFLGLRDYNTMSIVEARGKWHRDQPELLLANLIRRYRPEVVLVQDFDGEYGHGQHKLTAEAVVQSLDLAASEENLPEGLSPWQVKKLYVHLYHQNEIKLDWNRPLDETGVITPLFLATEAYDKHRSQHAYFSMRRDGVMYDNTCFGLYYTAVGPDESADDFLEHIR